MSPTTVALATSLSLPVPFVRTAFLYVICLQPAGSHSRMRSLTPQSELQRHQSTWQQPLLCPLPPPFAGNLVVTLSFDSLLSQLGLSGTYLLYALLNMAAAVYISQLLVETKCRWGWMDGRRDMWLTALLFIMVPQVALEQA